MEYLKNILLFNPENPLLFTQLYFWCFFAVVMLIYSLVYKKPFVRNFFLLIMSLFFYYKTGGLFLFLLLFSTIVDFFIGMSLFKAKSTLYKKLLITTSVGVNLLVLSYFKYTYLFFDWINQLFHLNFEVVNVLALWSNTLTGSSFDISNILLPVGVSFFTFQTISYTVEIYRGKLEPVRNIFDFGFYVSFFPQLVAGPIVRATQFIPQIYQQYSLSKSEMSYAFFLILNGLIKKMVISDYISTNFVDRVFDSPASYTGLENLMALYGYSLQIYCDFSGYTDIAIGLAQLLGFKLPINFYSPYKADSITDFWRRWHISLSTWLKDYLYIPLGGNRKGKFRTNLNLLITMLLGGLWHGANLRFVVWGALHGVALILHKYWLQINPFSDLKNKYYHFTSVFITFHFICFTWIFFRSDSFDSGLLMIKKITTDINPLLLPEFILSYKVTFILLFWGFVIHWLPIQFKEEYRGWFIQMPMVTKIIITVLVVIFIYQFKCSGIQPFIYFQF